MSGGTNPFSRPKITPLSGRASRGLMLFNDLLSSRFAGAGTGAFGASPLVDDLASNLTCSVSDPFVACQFFESARATGVELVG